MERRTYRLVVLEVDSDVTAEGCSPLEVECASTVIESVSPWDAVMAWGAQLSAEEASWTTLYASYSVFRVYCSPSAGLRIPGCTGLRKALSSSNV